MTVETRPLGNRVLIRPETNPTQTASGLHLAEHWKPEQTGTVVNLGPTVKEPMQRGDFVIFSWQAGQELYIDRERLFLLREEDVLAVIERTDGV